MSVDSPFDLQPYPGGETVPPPDLDIYKGGLPPAVTPSSLLADDLIRRIRTLQITAAQPANVRPTVWSDPIDLSATVVVPAVVGTYVTAVNFLVPKGYGARIDQYGVLVTNPAYTYDGTILWAFRKGSQLLGMGMSDWGEQRGSMVFPRKTVITLQAQERLEFQVRRALAPGPVYQVQMGFKGWLYRLRNTNIGTQSVATAY